MVRAADNRSFETRRYAPGDGLLTIWAHKAVANPFRWRALNRCSGLSHPPRRASSLACGFLVGVRHKTATFARDPQSGFEVGIVDDLNSYRATSRTPVGCRTLVATDLL